MPTQRQNRGYAPLFESNVNPTVALHISPGEFKPFADTVIRSDRHRALLALASSVQTLGVNYACLSTSEVLTFPTKDEAKAWLASKGLRCGGQSGLQIRIRKV